jgi:cobyrinic acid a,c-diamide synthase
MHVSKCSGRLPRNEKLVLPERHLGLVQASENEKLAELIDDAADVMESQIDLDKLIRLAHRAHTKPAPANIPRLPPPGQKVAVARDVAFAFAYEHMLLGWRRRGAGTELFFSAGGRRSGCGLRRGGAVRRLSRTTRGQDRRGSGFKAGMKAAIDRGVPVYGECGGYMVLGEGLIDAEGVRHEMLGALPLVTSFAEPKRHLGYRRLTPTPGFFWDMELSAHEFHYASVVSEGEADERLFAARDALGADLRACRIAPRQCGGILHACDRPDRLEMTLESNA